MSIRLSPTAPQEVILKRCSQQIAKKFGAKGQVVIESNMTVVEDGMEATTEVDYEAAGVRSRRSNWSVMQPGAGHRSLGLAWSRPTSNSVANGLFDPGLLQPRSSADRFKDGTIGEAAGHARAIGCSYPVASAAWKDKGLFRLEVPKYAAHLCTGCMECAVVCPDAAIPNTVHEIHDLMLTAIGKLEITEQHRQLMTEPGVPADQDRPRCLS